MYDTIIEPFAGAASYAMEYFDRKVILYEINNKIYSVWKYLQQSSPKDILGLPILKKGQCLNNEEFNNLTDPEKWTIGLFLNPGSSVPKKSPGNFCDWDEKHRKSLSEELYKIKHWIIKNESYENASDIEATWFIDAPYSPNSDNFGGKYYTNNKIDYNKLSEWCRKRKGQVIVCENINSNWLPFLPLVDLKGQKHIRKEGLWINTNII